MFLDFVFLLPMEQFLSPSQCRIVPINLCGTGRQIHLLSHYLNCQKASIKNGWEAGFVKILFSYQQQDLMLRHSWREKRKQKKAVVGRQIIQWFNSTAINKYKDSDLSQSKHIVAEYGKCV